MCVRVHIAAANLEQVKRYMKLLQTDPSAVKVRTAAHVGILLNGNLTGPGVYIIIIIIIIINIYFSVAPKHQFNELLALYKQFIVKCKMSRHTIKYKLPKEAYNN